ncbi:MAG: hypothetical protein ACYC2G_01250 [Gemmatimonadaceae bacterium]
MIISADVGFDRSGSAAEFATLSSARTDGFEALGELRDDADRADENCGSGPVLLTIPMRPA